jgi:hypothetical protein
MTDVSNDDKPVVQLTGRNGNAFAIIGACHKAWIRAGKPESDWLKIRQEMTAGDYDDLLCAAMDHFDVL